MPVTQGASQRVVEELVEKTVNEFIEKGWKPLGGVAIMQNEEGFYILYQAIIKE